MNQTLRASSIRFCEPASTPAPLPHPIANRRGCLSDPNRVVEAVRYAPHEDDPRAVLGDNWIIRERDPDRNILRESTALYASADGAYHAYWMGEVVFEAWVSPLYATSTQSKIKTNHIFPPIPDRSMDWCAYYDGEEERGDYGYGPTEEAAIADLVTNYEPA